MHCVSNDGSTRWIQDAYIRLRKRVIIVLVSIISIQDYEDTLPPGKKGKFETCLHGLQTKNNQGAYILSTGKQQQGMGMMSMGRRLETIKALTHCQQASSSKA